MSENGSMTTHKILAARKDTKLDLYLRFFFGDQGLLKLLRWYFRFLFQPGSLLYVSRDSDVLSIVAALCCFLTPAQQRYFIFPPSILPAPSHPQNKTYRCLLNCPGFAGAACPLFAFLLGCFWPCKSSIAQLKTKWGRAQGVNRKDRHPTNSPPHHLWSDRCGQAPWLIFHILSPDDVPAHSRQPPRSAPCLCRPCSGEQARGSCWCGGQGRGLVAAAIAVLSLLAATARAKGVLSALSLALTAAGTSPGLCPAVGKMQDVGSDRSEELMNRGDGNTSIHGAHNLLTASESPSAHHTLLLSKDPF